MVSKKIFKLGDFCDVAKVLADETNYLEKTINDFLSKEPITAYLGNPSNIYNIGNSIFNQETKSFSFTALQVELDPQLNIKQNYNTIIKDDSLTLKEYTYEFFLKLDKTFISSDISNADINWFYKTNISDELKDEYVASISIADDLIYKNKNQIFKKITLTDSNKQNPTIKNINTNFNLLSDDTIICNTRNIKGESFSYNGNLKAKNSISIKTETLSSSKTLPISNIDSNDTAFIRRDLSNLSSLNLPDKDDYENDDILNDTKINNLLSTYKSIDDNTIDKDYTIKYSNQSNQAITAKKTLSIIKTYIEEYYLETLNSTLENIPANNIAKLIKYYKDKISEMEDTYLLKKDYVLTSFYTYNNYCLRASNPITFKKQKKCIDSNVSIEKSNRVLTKNTLKCWLKQCLEEKVRL